MMARLALIYLADRTVATRHRIDVAMGTLTMSMHPDQLLGVSAKKTAQYRRFKARLSRFRLGIMLIVMS